MPDSLAYSKPVRAILKEVARQALWTSGAIDPPYDLALAAQHFGATLVSRPLGSINGFVERSDNGFRIVINSSLSERRRRFTIAHELGHVVLIRCARQGLFASFLSDPLAQRSTGLDSDDEEEQLCNRFAHELLLPEDVIRETVCGSCVAVEHVISTAQTFNVSLQVAANRIAGLFRGRQVSCSFWRRHPTGPVRRWNAGGTSSQQDLERIISLVQAAQEEGVRRGHRYSSSRGVRIDLVAQPVGDEHVLSFSRMPSIGSCPHKTGLEEHSPQLELFPT